MPMMMKERRVQHRFYLVWSISSDGQRRLFFQHFHGKIQFTFSPFSAQICHKTTSAPKSDRESCLFIIRFGAGGCISCMSVGCRVLVLSWYPTKRKGLQRLTAAEKTSSKRGLFAPIGMCRVICMRDGPVPPSPLLLQSCCFISSRDVSMEAAIHRVCFSGWRIKCGCSEGMLSQQWKGAVCRYNTDTYKPPCGGSDVAAACSHSHQKDLPSPPPSSSSSSSVLGQIINECD